MLRGFRLAACAVVIVGVCACNGHQASTATSPTSARIDTTGQNVGTAVGGRSFTHGSADGARRVHGAISNLAGTCPSVTFTLGATTVSTTSATSFGPNDCSALANGSIVFAEGATQADGSIAAIRVRVEPPRSSVNTHVEGTVSSLAGTCPAISFTVGTTAVTTTADTKFVGLACADAANGTNVVVAGTSQTDGSIVAAAIFIRRRR